MIGNASINSSRVLFWYYIRNLITKNICLNTRDITREIIIGSAMTSSIGLQRSRVISPIIIFIDDNIVLYCNTKCMRPSQFLVRQNDPIQVCHDGGISIWFWFLQYFFRLWILSTSGNNWIFSEMQSDFLWLVFDKVWWLEWVKGYKGDQDLPINKKAT